jgi:zinc transport system substrate-binding protein
MLLNRGVVGAVALAATVLVTAGCRDSAPKAQSLRPTVIASIYPLYDFARQVAGDRAEVISLVPAGVEPHDWEPSPRDAARIEKAAMFVYNGAGFDPGAERLAKSANAGRTVIIEATAGLPLLHIEVPAHEREHTHAKAQPMAAHDPHVWLDPNLARAQVEAIRAGFVKVDPGNGEHYAKRATDYTARLRTLHDAFESGLARCRRRHFVVSHAAFTYLAHRYSLLQVPLMGMSPEAEPSPASLATAVRVVRRLGAKVIFFETLVTGRLAETLAAEVGATTMVLNPVEGLTPDEEKAGKDYVALMEANLANLRTALECQ